MLTYGPAALSEFFQLFPDMAHPDTAFFGNRFPSAKQDQTAQPQQADRLYLEDSIRQTVGGSSRSTWTYEAEKWPKKENLHPKRVSQPIYGPGIAAYPTKSHAKEANWEARRSQVQKRKDPWTVRRTAEPAGRGTAAPNPRVESSSPRDASTPPRDGSNTPLSLKAPKGDESDSSQSHATVKATRSDAAPKLEGSAGRCTERASDRAHKRTNGFDLIWCDENAFRSTSEEKRMQIQNLGYDNVRCFKSPENCVRSLDKRIGTETAPRPSPPVTVGIVSARNAVVIPYLAAKSEILRMRGVIVLLSNSQKRQRFEQTFKTVPIVVGIASSWDEVLSVLQSPEMKSRLPADPSCA
jgi:hypothetical protein